MDHLTKEWSDATTSTMTSMGKPSMQPSEEPAVSHPIGVVVQAKPGGKVKKRSILDPFRARPMSRM